MGVAIFFHCLLFLLLLLLFSLQDVGPIQVAGFSYTRADFPREFVFGAATSAYQYEGAVAEDGRSPSTWDTFTHAGGMPDKSTADVAADGYHKYKEDVELMTDIGLEAYRFSISWSRLIPNGRGAVNPKGLEYYNNVINELVKRGIQIHVMLYQLDVPQSLEDEYASWLSPRIVEDFTAYADVCFREFGDRVSHWTTVDEPNVIAIASYDSGQFPPNRCSYPFGITNCTVGNSTIEPYIAVHNALLAHASVVKLYREKYQAMQKGVVGMNLYTYWSYPFTDSIDDNEATKRSKDFMFGWILNPLVFGDYPPIMRKFVGSRLPSFTKSQSKLVRGALDFIGINHYTSVYVSNNSPMTRLQDFNADMSCIFRVSKTDPPAGQFVPYHLPSDPEGLQHLLEYFKEVYGNYPIYIQENGDGSTNGSLLDTERVDYLSGNIGGALSAIRNGVNVKGYFCWALMDVFEFLSGYGSRYGLYYVDFEDDARPRQPKLSAHWYSDFLKKKDAMKMDEACPNSTYHAEQ